MSRVGVLGATGAVGRAAVAQLRAWRAGPLRLGSRRPDPAAGAGDEVVAVDAAEPASLDRFCAGCRVVLNCAGPARLLADRVARAASRAGADYVDAAGDDPLLDRVRSGGAAPRVAVLSAGMMPGLTALLPRYLATRVPAPATRLLGYVGDRDRFTRTAAVDYLDDGGYGEPYAAWIGGRRVSAALAGLADSWLPFFPEPAAAQPYLSRETERVAAALGLAEVRWYSVFAGRHLHAAVQQPRPDPDALHRAGQLDTFGHEPYQLLVVELSGADFSRTAVVRGRGASELTGAVAALATAQVAQGRVPPGGWHCGEVLDPAALSGLLGGAGPVGQLAVYDAPVDSFAGLVEEPL